MARATHSIIPALAAFIVTAALPAILPAREARAQDDDLPSARAIVLRFEGWRGRRARRAAMRGIASRVDVVSEDTAVSTARELGVDAGTPEGMGSVVTHLQIDLVVAGSVEGRGRNSAISIRVQDSGGNTLAIRGGPGPLGSRERREIGVLAAEAVDEARSQLSESRPVVAEPQSAVEPSSSSGAGASATFDSGSFEDPPEPGDDETSEGSGWRRRLLSLFAGVRLRTANTYVFDRDSNDRYFFEANPFPEIDLEARLRPLAEADDAAGLYFAARGSFSVGLEYQTFAGDLRSMTAFYGRFDVGYGFDVGDVLEILPIVGAGIEGVELDQSDGFASTSFGFVRPALVAQIRPVSGDFELDFDLGVGGRVGLFAGDLSEAYGPDLFFGGVDLFLGISAIIEPGFTFAVRGGYTYIALDFSGGGGPQGNGGSGADEVVDIRALIGWVF